MRETIHVCEYSAYTPPGGGGRVSAVLTYMYRFGHCQHFAHSRTTKMVQMPETIHVCWYSAYTPHGGWRQNIL